MVRQEDLWSALPLLLNHLRGDSASQQVFHRYGMKNTWLYVTLSLCVSVSAVFLERIHHELNLTLVFNMIMPGGYWWHVLSSFFCYFCIFNSRLQQSNILSDVLWMHNSAQETQRRFESSVLFQSVHFGPLSKITQTLYKADVTVPSGVTSIPLLSTFTAIDIFFHL